jgi:adenylate cyclase
MAAYLAADWRTAAEGFERLLVEFPEDGPARFFLERCRRFIDDPESGDQAGVIRMTAK